MPTTLGKSTNYQHLYGSSRLGMLHPGVKRFPGDGLNDTIPYYIQHKEQPYGARRYEITNHLGNVTASLSDRKMPEEQGGDMIYTAVVHSAVDYYSFGSLMTERTYSAGGYRYDFNTQERDDEIKGEGNHYSAEFWQYDPRVVHRWNLDPRPNSAMSGYAILGGNPIYHTDWAGDTTRIYNEIGEFQFSIFDNLPNEDHFLDKGLLEMAESMREYQGDPNNVGEVLRANSEFFIGANTRDQLQAIQKLYTTEAAFVLHPNENSELVVSDITHLSDPPATTSNVFLKPSSIRSYFGATEYSSLVGFGHTHLGHSTPSQAGAFGPFSLGDYSSILHNTQNYRPRHLLMVAGKNDFTIYTSFSSSFHTSQNFTGWIPSFSDQRFIKIDYDSRRNR